MSNPTSLIASLENDPGIIVPLIREVPPRYLKRRPTPTKWSVHEHTCHLSTGDRPFLARLDLILSTPTPFIKTMLPSPEEKLGALLNVDLDEALDQYVRERARFVRRRKELSAEDWQQNGRARGVQSLFGTDHVPSSAGARDAACLQD